MKLHLKIKNKPHNNISKQGMTITELLLAMGMVFLFVLGSTSIIMVLRSHIKNTESSGSRNLTTYTIAKNLSRINTLKVSSQLLPQNEKLAACVRGGSTTGCATSCCENEVDFDFYALDPTLFTALPTDRKKITGTTADPIKYSIAGENCDPSLPPPNGCAYQLVTSARAHCPGGTPTCDHAEYINVNIVVTPFAGYMIKAQTIKLTHFVNLNYKPIILPIPAQNMVVSEIKKISITPDPGFALEPKDFFFEKCLSSDTNIATVSCYGFIDGTGTIILDAKNIGTTNITLQVNDAQEENNLSDDMVFSVTIN